MTARRIPWMAFGWALIATISATPAHATFSGDGDVTIVVIPEGGGGTIARTPAQVLPGDAIQSIKVGDGGPEGFQSEGSLTIQQEGDVQTPSAERDLDNVDVEKGDITINSSNVFAALRIGIYGTNASNPPIAADAEIQLSRVRGEMNLQNGTLTISASNLEDADLHVRKGVATVSNSSLEEFDVDAEGAATFVQSSLTQATSLFTEGEVTLDQCTFDTGGFNTFNSEVTFTDTVWTMDGAVDIGDSATDPDTFLVMVSSRIESTSGLLRAGQTEVRMQLGSDWNLTGDLTLASTTLEIGRTADLHVESGSEVEVGDDLTVSGTSADLEVRGAGSVVDVADQLVLGGATTCAPGNLLVEDGGVVIVRGELRICAEAVVTLGAGGTIYAGSVNDLGGTIHENGGQIVLPETANGIGAAAAAAALCALVRRSRIRR